MNVILDAPDNQRLAVESLARAGEVSVRAIAEFVVLQEWLTVFGGIHDMDITEPQGALRDPGLCCLTPSA